MDLRLRIADSGEDSTAYWFLVELLSPSGAVLDTDRFRWAKQTRRPIVNPFMGDTPPPGWKPLLGHVEEANAFDYAELSDVAARHFLRRQGLVPGGKGRGKGRTAWMLASWRKETGQDVVVPKQGERHLPFLAQRGAVMRGAELEVSAPDILGILRAIHGHIGTVTTIGHSFDSWYYTWDSSCISTSTVRLGYSGSYYGGFAVGYSLASIGGGDDVTDVDFKCNVSSVFGGAGADSADIQAYHESSGGQTDPDVDSCPTMLTRLGDDTSPYLDGDSTLTSTGEKVIDLGTDADTDVKAAKDAVDRFALGFHWRECTGWVDVLAYGSGTTQLRLVVTHGAIPGPAAGHPLVNPTIIMSKLQGLTS